MTSALYLEHYLDSLQHLPVELQRNFKLMRDLDDRAHALMKKIDFSAVELQSKMSTMEHEAIKERIDAIQVSFNKAKEYGDDKVQLAIQTYELVDKHIRRLDSDLARFEAEIQDKALGAAGRTDTKDGSANPPRKGRKKTKGNERSGASATAAAALVKKKKAMDTDDDSQLTNSLAQRGSSPAKRKNQRKPQQPPPDDGFEGRDRDDLDGVSVGCHGDVLDMPVDPNEPTYCLCHQVSYGEMIGCDNSECPIEWFHFACVGLTVKPKGKWYCPKCTQDRKRK